MKERGAFEESMKQMAEGFSVKPPRSVFEDIKDDLPKESAFPDWNMSLLAVGMILCCILAIWFYGKYQQPTPESNTNIALKKEHILRGEKLFNAGCASCHNKDMKSKLTGPALGGITEKRSKEWLYEFTRNSQKMIASGDIQAVELWNEWKPTVMNSFPYLTDEELSSIFSYIEHVNYNASPKGSRGIPSPHIVNEEQESISGDSIFEIRIEGPVDSLLENGEFFHEEMELENEENF